MQKASKRAGNAITIAVAGDTAIDWNIARQRPQLGSRTSPHHIWGSDIATRACGQAGGATLLTNLLKQSFANDSSGKQRFRVVGPEIDEASIPPPSNHGYTHSYSIWSEFPVEKEKKETVWRVSEFCGIDQASKIVAGVPLKVVNPQVVVLDDADLGFRDHVESWPACVQKPLGRTRWVLVKMAHPVARGKLWKHLTENFEGRLVSVVPLSDLRKAKLKISYSLSWERIASEIVYAVKSFRDLLEHSTVVVTIEAAGAVIVSKEGDHRLIYDPQAQEGDWKRNYPGMCVGYGSCYAAALARELATSQAGPDLDAATLRGVNAARVLHRVGYAKGSDGRLTDLRFPTDEVINSFGKGPDSLVSTGFQSYDESATIVSTYESGGIEALAKEVVKVGPDSTLKNIPVERIGKWSSVDRHEIESIRSVRNIIEEYVSQKKHDRPLSLAVFGQPGSGKSFAIKELAEALMPDVLKPIEFNLTQFKMPEELAPAFHSIRDSALRDEIPLVFWDEFDAPLSRPLGWLKYFLVPMQDGKFNENGLPRPLGGAIFVFAGGVYKTLDEFRATATSEETPELKGRDFLSRLRGFLNILGPNPGAPGERAFLLRRALLLRSLLKKKAEPLFTTKKEVRIDKGVLHAFLTVGEYRHGARSMEAIIDMSRLSDKLMFERSSLPAPHQLNLHVNADEFLGLVSTTAEDESR